MSEQGELFTQKPKSDNLLIDYLEVNDITAWMTAANILARLRMPEPIWYQATPRSLREWAEQSDGRIISGNRGYRLIEHATPEERKHAANRLLSQGRKMTNRAIRILRRTHQIEGA